MNLPFQVEINHGCQESEQNVDFVSNERTRKRTRNPHTHKEYKRKLSVQSGITHITRSGNVITKKKFKAQRECICDKICHQKINVSRQKEIFKAYYSFENWSKKRLFLRGLVKSRIRKKKLNPITIKRKSFTHEYHLIDEKGITHPICQKFFLQCLKISKTSLYRALRSNVSNENAVDARGNFPNRKTDTTDLGFLCNLIQRFPRYKSHYTSSKSHVEYLNPSLNIIRMYREYHLVCEFHKRRTLSEWVFRNTFNTKFNLRFQRPKVDTCKRCDKLDVSIKSATGDDQINFINNKKAHLAVVERYKAISSETLAYAKDPNNHIEIRTFDLQRALEMPYISTSVAYYKRQLWLYNLCVYDEIRGIAYMYAWPESVASRGPDEIASCLHQNFLETIPADTEKIILYSDSCPGQNKNIKMTLMLKFFLDSWPHENLKKIEQRFYVVGHSYNYCDRNFALIEKQKKVTENIFIPDHWINLIKAAKKKDPKFVVKEMHVGSFLSSAPLKPLIINRKRSRSGRKISWLNFQTIIYNRGDPFILKVKEYDSRFSPAFEISLRKKNISNFSGIVLPVLFPNGRKISKKKFDDLIELSQYIPKKYHAFFQNLTFE